MKIYLTSDIHLEFGDLDIENRDNVDVLILSGDILVANDLASHDDTAGASIPATRHRVAAGKLMHDFIVRCTEKFPHVVFVMGNHEHYNGDFARSANIIRGTFGDYHNFYLLDKEWLIINGVLFYGGTLWTDFNREDPITMLKIRGMMNDFVCVKNSNRMTTRKVPVYAKDENGQYIPESKGSGHVGLVEIGTKIKEEISTFSPHDALEDHKEFLAKLDEVCQLHKDLPTVVVGHHAPSRASTHPKYRDEYHMNGAYSSDLCEFILDRRQIRLWTHGHTHEDFDYMIGTTRVMCNPRGYINYEERAETWQPKLIEI
jgi:Icc-related predicted phosphoesterase